jgi:hypothetical protein
MPRPIKGSDEAKSKMSHLRSLRKNKSSKEVVESKSEAPTESSKEEVVEEIVGTGKKLNTWIRHVQQFAKTHNINYFEALKNPKLKESYKK